MAIRNCVFFNDNGKEQLTEGKRVRTYQQVYKLTSDAKNESVATVLAHPTLPKLAAGFPGDPGSRCVSRDPKRGEHSNEWIVTLDYTSNPSLRTPPDEVDIEDPRNRPAVVERSPGSRQRIVIRDVLGNYAANTAGEPFNPPVERDEHPPTFTIAKNLATWPAALELAYTDAVNATDLIKPAKGLVYPQKTVKFNGLGGGERWENGFYFWAVTGSFEVNWETWNKDLVSAGFHEKRNIGGIDYLMPILGGNGERVAQPVLLNASGQADPFRTSPVTIQLIRYRELDLNAFIASVFGL